jgi:DNA primase
MNDFYLEVISMANRIPQQVIDEVRSRTNIVEIIGRYVQLKKTGKNYSGLCPFHSEKTPSFSVAEDKQLFKCFGCGKGGNVFTFIQEIEHVSFPEAVVKVADIEQIPIDVALPTHREDVTPETRTENELISLHEKAKEMYHHILVNTKIGEPALAYLENRGLSREIIDTFQIGFAPRERNVLEKIFKNQQISSELMRESGLFAERENGELLDRFFQRIMFPITNEQGKVVAFSGRVLEAEDFDTSSFPKYLNSPETSIFNKRLVLFNFDKARSEIRKNNQVYLFEGFMDVIAAWQSGIYNGVASMGTSLTNEQLSMLSRVAKKLVLIYDGDKAGQDAINRAINILGDSSKFELQIVSLPEKLDPDEYVRKYGTESFKQLAEHGRDSVFTFQMRYLKQNRNLENESEQLSYIEELLQSLTHVHSVLEQDMNLNLIAKEFPAFSYDALLQQFNELKRMQRDERTYHNDLPEEYFPSSFDYDFEIAAPPIGTQPLIPTKRVLSVEEKAERQLMNRIFNETMIRNRVAEMADFQFVHSEYEELYVLFMSYIEIHGNFVEADFLSYLKDDKLRNLAADVTLTAYSSESSEDELQELLQVIQNSTIKEAMKTKQQEQEQAKRAGNLELEMQLTVEIVNLKKRLNAFR